MTTSPAGFDLIKRFEGCKLTAYRCPAGLWTIGFGETKGVVQGMTITVERAEEMLRDSVAHIEADFAKLIHVETLQHQWDAMVSFAYNVGITNFRNSTLLKMLNGGRPLEAANQFLRWVYSRDRLTGQTRALPGLVKRRRAERELFLGRG